MHLVLFDIDGTLLTSKGAGRRAMRRALLAVYGTEGSINTYPMAGKTDQVIIREALKEAGLTLKDINARFDEYRRLYVIYLEEELQRSPPDSLPGAHALVQRLHSRNDILLGLLTGNLEEGAFLKLRYAGFEPALFKVGAFGSDAVYREELPPIAVQRAYSLTGRKFKGKDVVIVGDTPLDIQCSRTVDAKSVAVATGPYSPTELHTYGPDVVLPDLQNTELAERAILNGRGLSPAC